MGPCKNKFTNLRVVWTGSNSVTGTDITNSSNHLFDLIDLVNLVSYTRVKSPPLKKENLVCPNLKCTLKEVSFT